MFDKLSSVIQHPLSFFNNPPPLPNAHGIGPTFDWSTTDLPSDMNSVSMRASNSPAYPQHHGTATSGSMNSWSGTSTPAPFQTPARPTSAIPSPFKSTPSPFRSRLLSSTEKRHVHPYAYSRPPTPAQRNPTSEQLFDWNTVSSPTPSFTTAGTGTISYHAGLSTPVVHASPSSPYVPPTSFPILNASLPASTIPTNPPQWSIPPVLAAPNHAVPPVPAPTPPAHIISSTPRTSSPSFPVFNTYTNPNAPRISPSSFPILNSAPPVSRSTTNSLQSPVPLVLPALRPATPPVSVGTPVTCMSPSPLRMSSPSFPILNSTPSAPGNAMALPESSVSSMMPASNYAPSFAPTPTTLSTTGMATPTPRHVTAPARSPNLGPHTHSVLPIRTHPSPALSGVSDTSSQNSFNADVESNSGIFGKPNGLFAVAKPQATSHYGGTGATARMHNASTTLASQQDGQRPLFIPESPPPATTPMPSPPELALDIPPSGLVASTKTSQSSTDMRSSLGVSEGFRGAEVIDVDNELMAAYGMEIKDTGFQTFGGTVESSGKPKSSKSPRQKKVVSPNKWAGGPGGPMKFGTKPDGYMEVPGQAARWSYSEDGTHSQDVHDRMWGDVHFSPALDDDDGPFDSRTPNTQDTSSDLHNCPAWPRAG
ncbi:hypothetical protein FS749_005301 [Ceratobasidium sp. UAMH 11750]|nr:hypothetical protein FS749_005301 [Ceratobasidium sp. UAMH 11750]